MTMRSELRASVRRPGRIWVSAMLVAGLVLLPSRCLAMPHLLVESGKAKCVSVSVAVGTQLRVNYEAPDLDTARGPTWITINTDRRMERLRDKLSKFGKLKAEESKPLSEKIEVRKGTINHKVVQEGDYSICVRASAASSMNPMRFGLEVQTGQSKEDMAKKTDKDHLTVLESNVERLNYEMSAILDEADFAKEREMLFHNQSRSMSAASIYWPILHLSIMAITGVTMAGNITAFFKRHHII